MNQYSQLDVFKNEGGNLPNSKFCPCKDKDCDLCCPCKRFHNCRDCAEYFIGHPSENNPHADTPRPDVVRDLFARLTAKTERCKQLEEEHQNFCFYIKKVSELEAGLKANPYNPQAERDTVLNEKLASRYKAILVHCMDTIEDIQRKYEIAPKTCIKCSAYDLCEELHRQEGKEDQG